MTEKGKIKRPLPTFEGIPYDVKWDDMETVIKKCIKNFIVFPAGKEYEYWVGARPKIKTLYPPVLLCKIDPNVYRDTFVPQCMRTMLEIDAREAIKVYIKRLCSEEYWLTYFMNGEKTEHLTKK